MTGLLEPEDIYPWRRRVEDERMAGNLTATEACALVALVRFYGPEGIIPSEDTVAREAGCSSRTVRRAKAQAVHLGLLTWQHRRKVVKGRWRRSSNAYGLLMPGGPPAPRRRPTGQGVRRKSQEERKKEAREKSAVPIGSLADGPAPEYGTDAWGRWNQKRQLRQMGMLHLLE